MKSNMFMLLFIMIAFVVVSGCAQSQEQPAQEDPPDTMPDQLPQEQEFGDCSSFPDKLQACEIFSCEFTHPFTGELMKREILGLVNGNCIFKEEMPAGGSMDCEFSESFRTAVAQYHRDIESAESYGTSGSINAGTGQVEATYTIDGRVVDNPMEEAFNNGICTISGY